MNIRFSTLEQESIERLTQVFNNAFAGYFIPINMQVEQMAAKFRADNTKPELSAGAYDGDQLVGFIFHGYGELNGHPVVYNGGTGVLPAYRGQHLPARMYGFITPVLQQNNIEHSVLEVITENSKAIKVYEQQGFQKMRTVHCYKGTAQPLPANNDIQITTLPAIDTAWLSAHGDYLPTWQNSAATIARIENDLVCITALHNGDTAGMLVMNPVTGKLVQLVVAPAFRNQGIGKALMNAAAERNANMVMLNVDERDAALNHLLQCCGLTRFLSQYEMECAFTR